MSDSFNLRRRQQFVTEVLYANSRMTQSGSIEQMREYFLECSAEEGVGSLSAKSYAAFVYRENSGCGCWITPPVKTLIH